MATADPKTAAAVETSDGLILDLLRRFASLSVAELTVATGVTATAVRQRLTRLLAQGLVERHAVRAERGRPSHRYSLTPLARRQAGDNFADLAVVLWNEIRNLDDPAVRRGLLVRIAQALAAQYRNHVHGQDLRERLEQIVSLLSERKVPFVLDASTGELPVLTALECPYPTLAEQDRSICAVEKQLFTELLGTSVKLSQCRLDGAPCCQFAVN